MTGANQQNVGQTDYYPQRPQLTAVGRVWSMGWCAPVLLVTVWDTPKAADFNTFLEHLAAEIDTCPAGLRRAVLHRIVPSVQIEATQRREIAALLKERKSRLSELSTGYTFCSESALARGVLRAIQWLAPPAYPSFVAKTAIEGLKQLSNVDSRIDQKSHQAYLDVLNTKPRPAHRVPCLV